MGYPTRLSADHVHLDALIIRHTVKGTIHQIHKLTRSGHERKTGPAPCSKLQHAGPESINLRRDPLISTGLKAH